MRRVDKLLAEKNEEKLPLYPDSDQAAFVTTDTVAKAELTPEELIRNKKQISTSQKVATVATNLIGPIGFALGMTFGTTLKLFSPIAAGGVGLTIGTTALIGVTGGAAGVALLLGGFVYYQLYKKGIMEPIMQMKRKDEYEKVIAKKLKLINQDKLTAFKILLQLKVAKEKAAEDKENKDNNEKQIQKQLDDYINFLIVTIKGDKLYYPQQSKQRLLEELTKATKEGNIEEYLKNKENNDAIFNCFPAIVKPETPAIETSMGWTVFYGASAAGSTISASYIGIGLILGFTALNPFTAPFLVVGLIAIAIGIGVALAYHHIQEENGARAADLKATKLHLTTIDSYHDRLSMRSVNELSYLAGHYREKSDKLEQQLAQAKHHPEDQKELQSTIQQTRSATPEVKPARNHPIRRSQSLNLLFNPGKAMSLSAEVTEVETSIFQTPGYK